MNKKRCSAVIFGILLLILSVAFCSRLTMPKYLSASREGNLISEYYIETDAGNRHSVVFVGDCEAYSSFVPPVLWEKYGITSFVRGSPSQSLAQSQALILETLEYETPEVIVLSVYSLCKDDSSNEAYNRMTLDGMRLSIHKIRAVRESAGKEESVLSYFIPLLRFHSRWSELEWDDFRYIFKRPVVSHNGYFMQKGVVEFCNDGFEKAEAPHALSNENLNRLAEIADACKKRGVELILLKAPTDSWRYPWYDEWDAEISEFAKAYGIVYYSLVAQADKIGIDPASDSYDGGLHLNVYGAEKATVYFGELLLRNHNISTNDDPEVRRVWEEKVSRYYKERNE